MFRRCINQKKRFIASTSITDHHYIFPQFQFSSHSSLPIFVQITFFSNLILCAYTYFHDSCFNTSTSRNIYTSIKKV